MTLTDHERSLVRRFWSQGPSALLDEGFTVDSVRSFIARPDVVAELSLMEEEFRHSNAIRARTRYAATRNMAKLSDGAAAVLARAMGGPVFLRHPETQGIMLDARGLPIIKEAEITSNQIRAAMAVMGSMGVGDHRVHHEQQVGDFRVGNLIESAEEAPDLGDDPSHTTEEERALSRERVRHAIERLMQSLPGIRTKVRTGLGLEAPKKKVVKKKVGKRRVAKKKVVKKKKAAGRKG